MNPSAPVFIVDDDEGICRLITSALRKAGVRAEWKTSGAEALAWLREHEARLLILDLRLAEMSGQELLEALAKEERTLPFIVISGVADVKVAVELMKEGALDFLPKDTQLLQLVAPVVRRCLDRLDEQQRLAEAERRFLQLAENIQSVFWIATPGLARFIYVSPAYEHIWGMPVQTLYDQPGAWLEAVLPADLPALVTALERLKAGAEQMEIEFRIRRADDELRWLHWTASPLKDATGAVERLTGFVRDVTERKDISRRLVDAAEQERRRLGQDLHDDLCQRLAAIKLRCGLLARDLSRDGSPRAEVAEELATAMGDATALSRSFARGLSPVALDSDGLPSALEVLAASATTIFGISIRFECPSRVTVANADTASHLYRIAQELISNAAKHAHPRHILLRLTQEPDRVALEVRDDGTPFDGSTLNGDGMGFHFLRSRADAIGASLDFLPGALPNGGTTARCILSITPQSAAS